MGYTHYWKNTESLTNEEWKMLQGEVASIIDKSNIAVEWEMTDEYILINGTCETFIIERNDHFGYCKTNSDPYDEIVVAVLISLSEIAPSKYKWTSDGDYTEHQQGLDLYNSSLLYRPKLAVSNAAN